MVATGSASFELSSPFLKCRAAPFGVLVRRAQGENVMLPVMGKTLPFEVPAVGCAGGCSFTLRSLDAAEFRAESLLVLPEGNLTDFSIQRSFTILPQVSQCEV